MDMMNDEILRYYEAEMRYLREAGKEFSEAHPDRARLLNLDRVGDRDPYVERLFEGFAFLTARVRQKLDDELPELTEGLVSLLWPHYLRMIPSLSILEIRPDFASLQKLEEISPGMEIRSDAIGNDAILCTYRTTQSVQLLPITLSEASAINLPDGRSAIRLRFAISPEARLEAMAIPCLRLYLNADRPVASALHLALTRQVKQMGMRISGVRDGALQPMPEGRLAASGFADADRLWPKADNAFGGYQLLLEYFTFPEKFLFVDLFGIDFPGLPAKCDYIEIEAILDTAYPADLRFTADNVRLFCTPIINLFKLDSEPIRVNHHETEYRVLPVLHHGRHVETYTVTSVDAIDHLTGERIDYVPFSTFRHRGGMLRHEAPERFFHTRVRQGAKGLYDTWLILGGHAWETMENLPEETLSLQVIGTNGMLPRKALREAGINQFVGGLQNVSTVRNLAAPTVPLYPPTSDRFQWRVLSHLAPNFLSLMDAEVLRGALALYDWTDDALNRRRLTGIHHVWHKVLRQISGGAMERGVQITVTLDSHAFSGEGDVMLFGELLHRFFALYADLNLFTQFVMVSLPSGLRISWPASKSEAAPL